MKKLFRLLVVAFVLFTLCVTSLSNSVKKIDAAKNSSETLDVYFKMYTPEEANSETH